MPTLTPEQLSKLQPDNPIFNVIARMEAIQKAMTEQDPLLPTHLKEIWKEMKTYEELAHLLTPEDIGILMKGMQKHAGVQLVADSAGKSSSKKASKDVSSFI